MSIEIKRFLTVLIAILIVVFFIWQDNHLTVSTIEYKNSEMPKAFNDFNIVHISDLHNKKFGKNQKRLLDKIEKQEPDIIVVTGDLIDRRRYNLDISMLFIKGAVKIAPVYYVAGNHEAWSFKYDQIKRELIKAGVNVLDNEKIAIVKDNNKINILGLMDPGFATPEGIEDINVESFNQHLKDLANPKEFQILLSHRPELLKLYANEEVDLIFSGHAHGGQFRIPFVGGVFAPHQGFFPKYTSGTHKLKASTLVVSRGLGNSLIPIRIFNRPEIIKVKLKSE